MSSGESFVKARTRLAIAVMTGGLAGAAVAFIGPWQVAVLTGWVAAAVVFVGSVLISVWTLDPVATAAHATTEDDSRAMADVVLIAAAIVSLGAIGVALVKASSAKGPGKAAIITVAVLSVVAAWTVVHVVYGLRYARLYYGDGECGGVEFNDDSDPDYHDFAYLALTVGMTFQVSDTNITTRTMRRAVTRHAMLSYLFGAVVVAMAINVVAGLLNH